MSTNHIDFDMLQDPRLLKKVGDLAPRKESEFTHG